MYEPLVMLLILAKLSEMLCCIRAIGLITVEDMFHLYRQHNGDGVEKHAQKEHKNDA